MKKNLVWLASYPKSGNTWLRFFLANYLANGQKPVPINEVYRYGMGDSIARTYNMVAGRTVDTSDFDVTLKLRDRVLRGISGNGADVNFVKTHNINRMARGTTALIPHALTKSAIYIVRNPLDMVLSYAKHYAMTNKEATDAICNKDNALLGDATVAGSFLGRWTDHVASWTEFQPYPVLALRYEDMLSEPHREFTKVLDHIGVPVDDERLDRAVRFSSFKELKGQEKKAGFIERANFTDVNFFRQGQSGHWKDELEADLVSKIRKANSKSMKRFGYYDA